MKTGTGLRFLSVCSILLAVVGCGQESESKEKKAANFYAEKLHTSDQKTCNDKGKFYDNYSAVCGEENLARWACTRDGLIEYLDKRDAKGTVNVFDAEALAVLDQRLNEGFVMHQCGDTAAGAVAVILVKKGMSSDSATIELGRLNFIAPFSE